MRALFIAAALAACGAKQEAPRDLCLAALERGPPPATLECGEGASVQVELAAPSRLARIPGPGARSGTGVAERRWCAGPDGTPRGPYVALDRAGRVVESGRYDGAGERDGPWIIWAGATPRAVGQYRGGQSVGLEACDLGSLAD